jgi:hypothetical protein
MQYSPALNLAVFGAFSRRMFFYQKQNAAFLLEKNSG